MYVQINYNLSHRAPIYTHISNRLQLWLYPFCKKIIIVKKRRRQKFLYRALFYIFIDIKFN